MSYSTQQEEHIKSNKIDSTNIAKFEKFFESVAEGNNTSQESGDVCGGSQNNPHPCPPWNNSGIYKNSRTAIVNYLLSIGFHQTAWYASYNNNDYTKGCDAYGCSSPIFRTQAIIFQSDSLWSYRTQTPEPNPEIFSYTWPVWWWGSYVQW